MNNKIQLAIEKYLHLTHRDVIDWLDDNVVAFHDEDEVAIANVFITNGNTFESKYFDVKTFESYAIKLLLEDEEDVMNKRIRYDVISMTVIGGTRGFVKHYVNATDELLKD